MAKKLFPKRSLKPNFNRPGEIYFIRGVDLISGEQSPYVKIGLVGDRKESDANESSEDETQVAEVAFDGTEVDELEDESEESDSVEIESKTYEQFKARKSLDRLKEHQTGNPQKLLLDSARVVSAIAVSATEKAMHNFFAKKRVRGEWFYIPEDSELDHIIEECRKFDTTLGQHRHVIQAAAELSKFVTSESKIPATTTTKDLAETWRDLTANIQVRQRRMATIANLIGAEMNEVGEIDGVSTWTYRKPTRRFNQSSFKAAHESIYNLSMVPIVARGALTVEKKPKAPIPDPEMVMKFVSDKSAMEKTGARTEAIQALHLEYLDLIQESESLEWERLYIASALKVECDLSAGIEGVCSWQGKNSTRFSQPKLKEILISQNKLNLFEDHIETKPESYSFKLLPMRPYPI